MWREPGAGPAARALRGLRSLAWACGLVAGLGAAPGCSTGIEGTIALDIVTAPGSDVMDPVVTARLTLSDPFTVIEARRDDSGGLALALEVDAGNATGAITFEGLDASGDVVAYGRTAPLPIAAIDAAIAIYVARPMSLDEAPVAMEPARSDMGAVVASYGAVLAGGRRAGGAVAGDVDIYNVYTHDLQERQDLPAARAGPVLMAGAGGLVYIFGGDDDLGAPSADAWRFDAGVVPAGFYTALDTEPGLARSGAAAAPLGRDTFAITGEPLAILHGTEGRVRASAFAPALRGTATSVTIDDEIHTLFAGAGSGETGAVLLVGSVMIELEAPAEVARTGHGTVALADGTLLVLGGGTGAGLVAAGVRVDASAEEAWLEDGLLATPRRDAAIAATSEYVIAAGGEDEDGALVADAEVFDATTLERVANLPMIAPRRGARALPLANGQILIAGGTGEDGEPVAVLELFTPAAGRAF